VIRQAAGRRIAFVGVTRPPAHRKADLPFGWKIEDPAAALKALLPEISKAADVVVLLAVMDRIECAGLLREVPGIHLALVPAVGGSDPEPLRIASVPLVQSPAGPGTLGKTGLSGSSNRFDPVFPSDADHARARGLFAKHGEELLPAGLAAAPAASAKETGPLTAVEAGKDLPLAVGRSNPSVEIRIESIRVAAEHEGRKAPEGSAWLVIRSAWKNLIPLTPSGDRQVPTAYSVGDAGNNLYLVVNGKRLSRLEVEASGEPKGLLTGRSISIKALGDVRRGDLVFPIPASNVETLELRFYDFQRDPLVFPLLARAGAPSEEKPMFPAAKNEIIEAAVFRLERGKNAVVVDLRVRSLVTMEVEGRKVGVPGDLDDPWAGLRLFADGKAIAPEPGLPGTPRFLPGAMTGWDVVFLGPEGPARLELRWTFPKIGTPDGRTIEPGTLRIPLAGAARACPKCGEGATSTDKFCGSCGTKLGP
jgi:hypothetical protein